MSSSSEEEGGFAYESDDDGYAVSPVRTPTAAGDTRARIATSAEVLVDMEEQVRNVAETLALEHPVATLLLRTNGWKTEATLNRALEDRDATLTKAGIAITERMMTDDEVTCPVCWVPAPASACFALGCGHAADCDCWRTHICTAVRKGPDALDLSCVAMDCKIRVDSSVVRRFTDDSEYERFRRFELKNFVESQRNTKWCVNPKGCEYIAIYNGFEDAPVVNCKCGYGWCFKCGNEMHNPCSCDMVDAWFKKNQDSSEDIKWIMANTKPCPKCKTPIEKNQGCMHMTCRTSGGCGHEFCWLCLGPWSEHGTGTGGYYQCNIYSANKEKFEDKNLQIMKQSHDRYMRYYQRYHEHGRSKDFAEKLFEQAKVNKNEFERRDGWDGEFYLEAAELVITCRHTLKWTYVYGYYLDPDPKGKGASELLFETQLAQLETHTDKLTELIESPIEKLVPEHIKNFTRVTSSMLRNLVNHWQKSVAMEED